MANTATESDIENRTLSDIPISEPGFQRDNSASASWSECAANLDASDFTVVTSKRRVKSTMAPRVAVLKGTKTCSTSDTSPSSSVHGVPRRLTAYVGRLHKDTTEDDLSQLLKSSGIADPVCKKLKSKGVVYRTAAFFVSCSSEWKHIFHNEDTWPAGCELRDWMWHNNR